MKKIVLLLHRILEIINSLNLQWKENDRKNDANYIVKKYYIILLLQIRMYLSFLDNHKQSARIIT